MRKSFLIAPCGMNCGLCSAFQRTKNTCTGCNGSDENKPNYCKTCSIKFCPEHSKTKSKFCYSCEKFPCKRLKQLDLRYRTRYGMSMIENLQTIKEQGINKFMRLQKERWTCKNCNSLLCVHKQECLKCGSKNEKYMKLIKEQII